ncbi:ArsR/SmtB family transcription factor [Streptomyces phaeochromogenes]|uniref:ArsR/SmtB family transcription factor n=1 Tax=Streptomyces phaeochromogenes TaxID=1923 RepID=UPI003865E686|nr:metalloregulator ArsR/SmtB family transcription factor [Streptomyces phaeochromogenes]
MPNEGQTKTRAGTVASDVDVLARFGRSLADPIRCRILLALREAPAYPADLADTLGVSRTRLSNHLACLRDCGLVVTAPEGRRTRYELADPRLGHALDDLRAAVVAVATDRTCVDADDQGLPWSNRADPWIGPGLS